MSGSELIARGGAEFSELVKWVDSQLITPKPSKADTLMTFLKIAVKRRDNLRQMFTNESKKLAQIFNKVDKAEIAEDDTEQLKASQQNLSDAWLEMGQLDKTFT